MNYKAKLTQDANGDWHIISYSNRQIPTSVFFELNNAVHNAIDKVNGKLDWKQSYIRFSHNGKNYHQEETIFTHCEGCCFRTREKCTHPYFSTKGNCEGRIYKED